MSCTLRYPSACSVQPRTECDEHKLQLALEVHLLSPRPQPQLVQLLSIEILFLFRLSAVCLHIRFDSQNRKKWSFSRVHSIQPYKFIAFGVTCRANASIGPLPFATNTASTASQSGWFVFRWFQRLLYPFFIFCLRAWPHKLHLWTSPSVSTSFQKQEYILIPEAICQILSISNNVVLSFSRIGARRKCACGNVWWWRGVCVMCGVVLGASHFIAIYCNIIVLSDFAIKLQ